MGGPAWPTRASVGSETRRRSDPSDEPSEPNLGRAQDSRRTAQTRYEHWRDQREQVLGPSPEAAIAGSKIPPGPSGWIELDGHGLYSVAEFAEFPNHFHRAFAL